MFPVKEVSDLQIAFGGSVQELMPAYKEIPMEFREGHTKWNQVFNDWFFHGLKNATFRPKEGIDPEKALRHLKAIMSSFWPKHEHKEAAVAYLLSQWFHDVTYEVDG
jgi:hypothetical protein